MTRKRRPEVDRYAPAERLVRLAFMLSEAHGGLTLDEMAAKLNITRRTAERLRNKIDHVTDGSLIATFDEDNRKRWRLPIGKFNAFTMPTMEELAELKLAAASLRNQGAAKAADAIGNLVSKLETVLPRGTFRRYEPDIEALLDTSGNLVRPGPKVRIEPVIIDALRRAILECRQVQLTYEGRSSGLVSHPIIAPHGFLSGSRGYVVARKVEVPVPDYRLYALTHIQDVTLLDTPFVRDPDFDLRQFTARSFGVFWDGERFDVEWRFKPHAAADARAFLFHPEQIVTEQPDGSVIIAFRASGLNEMAWHLFTWGNAVEILKPQALRDRFRALLEDAQRGLDCSFSTLPAAGPP